ncbi:cyclic nucleotide-binding domain-containing protein [Desulfonema magnum]|uniref:Cyclic nucleotide-binding domain-containing protein n=1 Tax=Desulfonema magnum TaxID=45655 RepID=A0A975BL31_9BACT|nr:cyclic nucleotide-binding domain-containing protein [Desulfonema magnum]QTA87410.1 Cyclic nucleotide-binding domain-containing protein [Desulfonema magnum]
MISLDFLKKVEVLKSLNDEQLTAVQGCCEEKVFQSGARLFSEGEEATHLCVMMEGQVDLRFDLHGQSTSDANNISSLTESATFGWSAFVPPNKYKLSAYCATRNCKVLRMERDCLLRLFEQDTEIGYRIMTNVNVVIAKRFQQLRNTASDSPAAKVEITVHMATCGIAAGAREVMGALMEEVAQSGRKDIRVKTSGCLGKCATEPNVTVNIGWEEPVIYQYMNSDKMRQVFRKHILSGQVQSDFVLAEK